MKKLIIALALGIFLFACESKKTDLKKELPGEWRNTYLHVTMNTFNNGDSSKVTTCDSSNWEQMLHIKPIRTFFNEDGTYRSEYYNLNDSLFLTSKGTWRVSGDTLTMSSTEPSPESYKLKTTITSGVATFEGMLDFDSDGKADDHYIGKQRRQ